MSRHHTARATAVQAAARALVAAVAERAAQSPHDAAAAAYYPGHPLGSIAAIEAEIVRRRRARVAPALTQRAA
jgi:hypothetical protein